MTTVIIIVAVVLVVAALAFFLVRSRTTGGRGLRHRFGPEYDHTVARHDGDTKAAEEELAERVRRHGSLDERPLPPGAREEYAARWAAVQEQFVNAPQEAVSEADALLARLARDRGFPDGASFEEQTAALSVHHAAQVGGYRKVHTAVRGQEGTEDMRKALLEARALFDVLLADAPGGPARTDRHEARGHRHETKGRTTS